MIDKTERSLMILAIDVDYQDEEKTAQIAGVVFSTWQSTVVEQIYQKKLNKIEPYEAGAFYKRILV